MKGLVDESLRALVELPVAAAHSGERTQLTAWVDTAFNGGLTIPREQIAALKLLRQSQVDAILADGSQVVLETFTCFVDWFGKTYGTQITASDGHCALLGTMLLDNRRLCVDYKARTVEIE